MDTPQDPLISKSAAEIAAMSDEALRTLLAPLFPVVRTPVLPSEAAVKETSQYRFVKGIMSKYRKPEGT